MEISETLAKAKEIANGDRVKVSSKRGFIRAVAVVTRRLQSLNVHGQQVETVGIPLHWGFEGVAQKRLHRQYPDAKRWRFQLANAGVQSVSGQHRESVRSD